jgi:hypothetical protein
VAAALAAMAAPAAFADDFNYLGRGDTVTLATGNANRANLAIQHPTPWPRYVNDVFIEGNGPRSVITITDYYNKSDGSKAAGPSTVINVNGGPAQ